MPRRILRWQSWVWAIITPGLMVIFANWINIPVNFFPVVALLGLVVGYLLQWQFGDPRLRVNLAHKDVLVEGNAYPNLKTLEVYARRDDARTLVINDASPLPGKYSISATMRGYMLLNLKLPEYDRNWRLITLFFNKQNRIVGILDVSSKEFCLIPISQQV